MRKSVFTQRAAKERDQPPKNTPTSRRRVAIVMSDIFLQRVTPGLIPFVHDRQDYSVIDIQRPVGEILRLLEILRPVGLLTESLPYKTERLLALRLPTIIADSDHIYPGTISLDVDDWKVGEQAAVHLLDVGFRHFAFFGNLTEYSQQRQEGYTRKLREAEFKTAVYIEPERSSGRYLEFHHLRPQKLVGWLRSLPRPAALFAAHDPLGRLIAEVCLENGIAVPEEISIVGANDDKLVCNLSSPPLSSVGIPWTLIGKMLGELMDELILDKKRGGRAIRVQPESVTTRESSRLTAVDDAQLRRALNYMQENYREPISVKSVCAALKINRRTLELKCQSHLGRSPHDEIVRLKVARAKALLTQTERGMEWIAQESGFINAERLCVVFRASTGEPPSAYRRRFR